MYRRWIQFSRLAPAIAAAAFAAACTGPAETSSQSAPNPAGKVASADAAAPTASEPVKIGALAPRELKQGQCAMFLWAKRSRTRFVFFAQSQGKAVMALNGKERVFERTAAEGNPAFGQFTKQRFKAEAFTLALTIEVEARKGVLGGAVIPRGALRVNAGEGWKRILPVAGLIACKSR